MRKTIVAATVAMALGIGGIVGAALGAPALAGAAGTAGGAVSWVQEALSGLVDDDTITQEQADAVAAALEQARPDHGGRGSHRGGFTHHADLTVIADALGITQDELRAALDRGQTVAEVAADNGADVQAVIDAVVAATRAHLDEKVAAGDLTQEQADQMLADATERARRFVNGDAPTAHAAPHEWPAGDGGDRHNGRRGHDATATES